ncbi:diacylglycerol/lipid kinase family protein [Thermodesulfobacteriota bacterium]
MNRQEILFIVNPHSANGLAGKRWLHIEALASSMGLRFAVRHTERVGHATHLTREAVEAGVFKIACVGGDGTFNEVVNGLISRDRLVNPQCCVGVVPFGTGCDFVRSMVLPRQAEEALKVVAGERTRLLDVGRLDFTDHQGNESTRYFVNITSFGLGGEVDARVNRTSRRLGGFISFLYASLVSILLYSKKRIRLVVDDGQFDREVVVWNVVVANGQFHGGGMWIAPSARLDDGLFDITILGDFNLFEIFRHFPKLYSGRVTTLEKVTTLQGRRVQAFSRERVLLDVDGEQPGELPARMQLVPRALPVLV